LEQKRMVFRRSFAGAARSSFRGSTRRVSRVFVCTRTFVTHSSPVSRRYALGVIAAGGFFAGAFALSMPLLADAKKADYNQIRKEIEGILEANPEYDDGSVGPVFVRLAWHAAGTFDKNSKTGGSNGATMRFRPEAEDGANAGLDVARKLLERIKAKHPEISYADLWTLAGAVAIEAMGGPHIPWRSGRTDAKDEKACPPPGRLPDASKEGAHIRDVFYRMGFNDREIVALVGAHALGRCHTYRSGYQGAWTRAPTTFSNEFFRELVENKWVPRKWDGPLQFTDATGELMMLPADLALLKDAEFKKYVDLYAKDEATFFKDFAAAFSKLLELGVPFGAEEAKRK